ncbi:MAG: hypothetical protein ACTXOH_16105 [Sodalis sp. (in: enterobacteria)]|uniref:hypothetical protein n=1 Tax=Sodalis sp. (in: enterobacteria) TaxID=1898979 RepID=UPI003FD77C4F
MIAVADGNDDSGGEGSNSGDNSHSDNGSHGDNGNEVKTRVTAAAPETDSPRPKQAVLRWIASRKPETPGLARADRRQAPTGMHLETDA